MCERPSWLRGSSLLLESGGDRAEKLAYQFARKDCPRRVFRWTGGCGFMDLADWHGLRRVSEGFIRAGEAAKGHHLLGGTRMRGVNNPDVVIPGITEAPVDLRDELKEGVRLYGLAPKTKEPILNDTFGTIISIEQDESHPCGGYFTHLRGDVDVTLFFQPSANENGKYDDERRRAVDVVSRLLEQSWPALLISYNGGGVTRREIEHWCKLIDSIESWREQTKILLIKGSGRTTDEFANDSEFLAKYRENVVVAECNPDHIAECVQRIFPQKQQASNLPLTSVRTVERT